MKITEIAKAFGMNAIQFANLIGYSRQSINLIERNKIKMHPRRWHSAMKTLEFYIVQQYERDKRKADDDFRNRQVILAELRKWPEREVKQDA